MKKLWLITAVCIVTSTQPIFSEVETIERPASSISEHDLNDHDEQGRKVTHQEQPSWWSRIKETIFGKSEKRQKVEKAGTTLAKSIVTFGIGDFITNLKSKQPDDYQSLINDDRQAMTAQKDGNMKDLAIYRNKMLATIKQNLTSAVKMDVSDVTGLSDPKDQLQALNDMNDVVQAKLKKQAEDAAKTLTSIKETKAQNRDTINTVTQQIKDAEAKLEGYSLNSLSYNSTSAQITHLRKTREDLKTDTTGQTDYRIEQLTIEALRDQAIDKVNAGLKSAGKHYEFFYDANTGKCAMRTIKAQLNKNTTINLASARTFHDFYKSFEDKSLKGQINFMNNGLHSYDSMYADQTLEIKDRLRKREKTFKNDLGTRVTDLSSLTHSADNAATTAALDNNNQKTLLATIQDRTPEDNEKAFNTALNKIADQVTNKLNLNIVPPLTNEALVAYKLYIRDSIFVNYRDNTRQQQREIQIQNIITKTNRLNQKAAATDPNKGKVTAVYDPTTKTFAYTFKKPSSAATVTTEAFEKVEPKPATVAEPTKSTTDFPKSGNKDLIKTSKPEQTVASQAGTPVPSTRATAQATTPVQSRAAPQASTPVPEQTAAKQALGTDYPELLYGNDLKNMTAKQAQSISQAFSSTKFSLTPEEQANYDQAQKTPQE